MMGKSDTRAGLAEARVRAVESAFEAAAVLSSVKRITARIVHAWHALQRYGWGM